MRCPSCGGRDHSVCRPSHAFGAPHISTDALPNKHPVLKGELAFERQVVMKDRDAYKTMRDAGLQPPRMKGSEKFLQALGG